MASSSTSYIHKSSFKYDVFLSFRGEDTRTSFVDHLYHALKQHNIKTYKDDKDLQKGKKIGKELFEAIEDSRFHIIVFSKNYASSSWCLNELVKIMECQRTQTEQTVYPIFYDVEPTQVRKQSEEFGKAFAKHENDERAEEWRKAMGEASSFSGWDLSTTANGHEVEFIKIVVKEISLKLPSIGANGNLVGMRTRINGVVSSLNAFPDEFCMIGIVGMGGSGKTTLARAVFDQICNEFEGISFVENVRDVSKPNFTGLKKLQKQVLRDVLNDQGINVSGVLDGKMMMKRKMFGRKVLVVLDDVDHIDQLKALAGEPNWFKPGSKIIITTRDKQVLVAHKVNLIHDVSLLSDEEAICLLSRCAFGTEIPIPRYEELSRKVASYAAGLPLTITILGSSLCNANEHVWIDTLARLEKIPLNETLQKLELSYMGLDTDCKEIFLDVACILNYRMKDEAIRALESRGFHAIRGLTILENKSLINISKYRYITMHDSIEEMGKYIVRRLHPEEPNKHSRLWIQEEINDILANNRGTKATICVHLVVTKMNLEIVMKGLGKMEKLKLLYVDSHDIYSDWELDEVSHYFPNSLQYVNWKYYPFCSLPKTFQASNLVGLDMYLNKMEQLWKRGERKVLHKLRFFDFGSSELKTFDLGLTPNLEKLNLEFYHDSVEICMPLGYPKLKSLKLRYSKLRSLNLGLTPNLETLILEYCDDLVKLDMPRECPQLKSLKLRCPNLRFFNFGSTPDIDTLKVKECDYLVELDMFFECPLLESLELEISRLRILDLGPTPNLEILNLFGCYNLVELRMHDECCKLTSLGLGCPRLRTFDFPLPLNLKVLNLDGHDDLVELLISCPELEYLLLENSKLTSFELTMNLKTLILKDCDMVELHIPNGNVMLEYLRIQRCSELKTLDLGRTPNLKDLCLEECSSLVKLHAPVGGVKKLIDQEAYMHGKSVNICPLHSNNKEDLPLSIEKLISDGFSCACTDLEGCFGSICRLQQLTTLSLRVSISKVPKDLDRLQCLEYLTFSFTRIRHLPDSLCMLKRLKLLQLDNCELLEKLPDDLGRLECLEMLNLEWCIVLRDIPNSICRMKRLKYFHLCYCMRVEELPEELGRLECLEKLDIRGTCINNLPRSILLLEGLEIVQSEDETPDCCTML